MTAADQHYLK